MNFSLNQQTEELFETDPKENRQPDKVADTKAPRYYRQRVLLNFIACLGDNLTKTDIQKLMFLFMQEFARQDSTSLYEYIPYEHGCYSFACALDLKYLLEKEFIAVDGHYYHLRGNPPAIEQRHLNALNELAENYGKQRGAELMKLVAQKHPRFSRFNSPPAPAPATQQSRLEDSPAQMPQEPVLFTIGYEGLSFEAYINKLLAEKVRLLCDVRADPFSHKPGFSKQAMEKVFPKVRIVYASVPGLGVPYQIRHAHKRGEAVGNLFDRFRQTLKSRQDLLADLASKTENYGRVAITCFEKLPEHCHRHCVSEAIAEARPDIQIRHL